MTSSTELPASHDLYKEGVRSENRRKIWAACVNVAAVMGAEPEQQSEDSLRIYKFVIDIALDRYADEGEALV
jgi:hypothetical protein